MQKKIHLTIVLIMIWTGFTAPAYVSAVVAVDRSFDELVEMADMVLVGKLLKRKAVMTNGTIYSYLRFQVNDILKGENPGPEYTVRVIGGRVPPYAQVMPGAPQFQNGKEYVLFIRGNGSDILPFVGVHQGIYRIVRDEQGEPYVLNIAEEKVLQQSVPIRSLSQMTRTPNSGRSLQDFKQQIKQRLNQ